MRSRRVWHQTSFHLIVLLLLTLIPQASTRLVIPADVEHRGPATRLAFALGATELYEREAPSPDSTHWPVVSAAVVDSSSGEQTATRVHIKLEARPEVVSWRIYKTTQYQRAELQIGELARAPNETIFDHPAYASYVVVEALDGSGSPIARSDVVESVPPVDIFTQEFIEEKGWLQDAEPERPLPPAEPTPPESSSEPGEARPMTPYVSETPLLLTSRLTFAYGAMCGVAFVMLWRIRRSLLPKVPGWPALLRPGGREVAPPRKIY